MHSTVRIIVSDHALWRAAERYGRTIGADEIEAYVRDALAAGRVSTERGHLGLHEVPDPASLYVWTPSGQRVFALRVDRDDEATFVVTTSMRPYALHPLRSVLE